MLQCYIVEERGSMKKKLYYFVILSVLSVILVACAGQNTESSDLPPDVSHDSEIVELIEQNENIVEPTTLTISTFWNDSRLNAEIEKFKEIHKNVEIIVDVYEADFMTMDFEKYATQVSVGLMSGTAGDIIMPMWIIPNFNFMNYIDNGLLVDFYTLMENDPNFDPDDYLMNVFKAKEYKGGLYEFPIGFEYKHIAANSHFSEELVYMLNEVDSVTYDDLFEIYKNLDNAEGFYFARSFNITAAILENLYKFIDFENKTCKFDTAEFVQFITDALAFTNPDEVENTGMGSSSNMIPADEILENSKSYLFQLFTDSNYHYFLDYEWNNPFPNLKPLADSDGRLSITPSQLYAIPASSQNQELAWEFIKFLTSEDADVINYLSSFPVRKDLFIDFADHVINHYMILAHTRNIKGIPLPSADKDEPERLAALAYFEELSTKPKYTLRMTKEIADIIKDEMNMFRNSVITAEQAGENLQQKISLILMESN